MTLSESATGEEAAAVVKGDDGAALAEADPPAPGGRGAGNVRPG